MYRAWQAVRHVGWRSQHTAAREARWRKGQHLHNYTVLQQVEVPEMNLNATHLLHHSGAEHLHVCKEDSDNVFAVAFRTPPNDSTGVPHILEHVSLCGSKQFPVRGPFFKMLTRSLSTFMNAFTANDWTMYPFSSQNSNDFSNLMRLYLDATFQPLLRYDDFLQEGWRLEHSSDASSPLELKGVVYNEMKGVFSDPHQVFSEAALNHLHSTGTYSFVSGGHPKHIPSLSWQQLKDFHSQHYHPANARFFTYGNLPLDKHLSTIDAVLSSSNSLPSFRPTTVPPQPRWTSPKRVDITCPIDHLAPDLEHSCMVSTNFLLCDVTDSQECFELSFLSSLLIDGPQSPFYIALIESGLGAEYSTGTGFSTHARDASFSVGVQRIHKSRLEEVSGVVEGVMEGLVREAFPQERIQSLLHQIELSLRHQTDQFGLKLLLSIIPAWNHGAEPTQLLQVTRYVDELKRRLAHDPAYLQQLVQKHFCSNSHKLLLTAVADEEYAVKVEEEERGLLSGMVEELSDARKSEIWRESEKLREAQEKEEDLQCLPCLRLEEVEREHERVKVERVVVEGVGVHTHLQPTNGVTYVRMVLDASHLPPTLLSHLPLFCHLLTTMGAAQLDFKQQSQEMDLHTGGLHASPLLSAHPLLPHKLQTSILLSSHCLDRNVGHMMRLWSDIFVALSLSDHQRLTVLLSSLAADSASVLSHNGHRFAMKHSASQLSAHMQQLEALEGVSQLTAIKNLLAVATEEVVANMQSLSQLLLPSSLLRSSLHCQPSSLDAALQAISQLHSCTGGQGRVATSDDLVFVERPFEAQFVNTHLQAPFQVSHVGRSYAGTPLCHPDHPPLRLLASLLSSKHLHKAIREQGGAYGGGCLASPHALHFFSYRDPSPATTLTAFSDSLRWAADGNFSEEQLREAKLAVFSTVDKPLPPGSQGLRGFLHGISDEDWSSFRERLFSAGTDDLVRLAKDLLGKPSSSTLIGPALQEPSSYWSHHAQL